jgi:Domain of unknown function (DUF4205)
MKEDMQDQSGNSLIDPMGECTTPVINLVLFGKATPYLHNGAMMLEDENGVVSSISSIYWSNYH